MSDVIVNFEADLHLNILDLQSINPISHNFNLVNSKTNHDAQGESRKKNHHIDGENPHIIGGREFRIKATKKKN